jgi:hypothetical protein
VILPGILSLALALSPQQPAGAWCTVSAADADVAAAAVAVVEAEVEPALARVRQAFPDLPKQPFRIVVHASESALPAALRPLHHEGSPGFALLGRSEIHLLLAEARATTGGLRPVLVHEMTHELLHQACAPWGDRIPRWFHEGLAQVVAGDTYLDASEEVIAWRAAMQQLLPFSELGDRFPTDPLQLRIAYAQSYSFVAWLEQRIGLPAVVAMARSVDGDRSLELALVLATNRSTADVFEEWRDHVVHGSGAVWRVVLRDFFALSMILAVPLLAMAMIRRMRADRLARERLARDEAFGAAPEPMPEPDVLPEDDDVDGDAADDREDARVEETGDRPATDGKTLP